jgi:hypothetical protein
MSLISTALSRYPNFDALASVEREGRWCQCCSRGSVLGSILGRQTAAGNSKNLAALNKKTTSQVQAKISKEGEQPLWKHSYLVIYGPYDWSTEVARERRVLKVKLISSGWAENHSCEPQSILLLTPLIGSLLKILGTPFPPEHPGNCYSSPYL